MDKKRLGLPQYDAVKRSFEIVKRDGLHLMDKDGFFTVEQQVKMLTVFWMEFDIKMFIEGLKAIEADEKILEDEARFLIRFSVTVLHTDLPHKFEDCMRYQLLSIKYKVDDPVYELMIAFPELDYAFRKQLCFTKHSVKKIMKDYKNFKNAFSAEGIFALLPSGKSYGGFVKAYLYLKMAHNNLSVELLATLLVPTLRIIYNSQTFSNKKRLEWFSNLDISAEDCASWTRTFDQKFSSFKDVHKFFGQIA